MGERERIRPLGTGPNTLARRGGAEGGQARPQAPHPGQEVNRALGAGGGPGISLSRDVEPAGTGSAWGYGQANGRYSWTRSSAAGTEIACEWVGSGRER